MRAKDTKKRSTRFHDKSYHKSYGIQNWLVTKRYCMREGAVWRVDPDQYRELIKEFCLTKKPNFKPLKKLGATKSYEAFIHSRFKDFTQFAGRKYSN